jgi:hypothetical protein
VVLHPKILNLLVTENLVEALVCWFLGIYVGPVGSQVLSLLE